VNSQVQEGRYRKYMLRRLSDRHGELTTPRSSDLRLWLLRAEEDREALLAEIRSPVVFNILYTR